MRVSLPVIGVEIRAPGDDERDQLAVVMATSLNFSAEAAIARSHLYPVENGRVEPMNDAHWAERIMARTDDESRRAVVVREQEKATGFLVTGASTTLVPSTWRSGCGPRHSSRTPKRRCDRCSRYVRRFGGLGKWFQ